MKKLLVSLVAFISLTVFAQETRLMNDANAITRSLNGSFTGIAVSSGVELYITQGNEEAIAVSASEQKHLDRLKTEVVNGTLKIYYDNKGVTWKSNGKSKLKAYVSFKTLEKLNVSAGSEVTVNGTVKSDKLRMDVSSGADFTGAINVTELNAVMSSGAGIKVTGTAGKLIVDASSGADFKGYDFAVDFCDASASSGADIHVTINKELNAKASSGGGIQYKGTALIRDIKTGSGGSVKKR